MASLGFGLALCSRWSERNTHLVHAFLSVSLVCALRLDTNDFAFFTTLCIEGNSFQHLNTLCAALRTEQAFTSMSIKIRLRRVSVCPLREVCDLGVLSFLQFTLAFLLPFRFAVTLRHIVEVIMCV